MLLLLFLLYRENNRIARNISPCLEKGNFIRIKNQSQVISFEKPETVDKSTVRCLMEKGFNVVFSCSEQTSVCISDQKPDYYLSGVVQGKPLMDVLTGLNIFIRILITLFISVLILYNIFLHCFFILHKKIKKGEYWFFMMDSNFRPMTRIPPYFKYFKKRIKILRKSKNKLTENISFELKEFSDNTYDITFVIFPIKGQPQYLCLMNKKSYIKYRSDQPFDLSECEIDRDDMKTRTIVPLYCYPDEEVGLETEDFKLRIKKDKIFCSTYPTTIYFAFSCMLEEYVRQLIDLEPTIPAFQHFFRKIFLAFDLSGISLFIKTGSCHSEVVNISRTKDSEQRQTLKDILYQMMADNPKKSPFIVNLGKYKYVCYFAQIDDTCYYAIITLDLKRFILRGPERSFEMMFTFCTLYYHINLRKHNERNSFSLIEHFLNKSNLFQVLELKGPRINEMRIKKSIGKIFPDVDDSELLYEIEKQHIQNTKGENTSVFGGTKYVYFCSSFEYNMNTHNFIKMYFLYDSHEYIERSTKLKANNKITRTLRANIGGLHLIKHDFSVVDAKIGYELGYTNDKITSILDIIAPDDVNLIQTITKKESLFRLTQPDGEYAWYVSVPFAPLFDYDEDTGISALLYRLPCGQEATNDIKEETKEMRESLLSVDPKCFGIWSIDQINGHVLISIANTESQVFDYIELVDMVHPEDRQVFFDALRTMNSQIMQIRTLRMNFATKDYEWYECTFYQTTNNCGNITALNVHKAKNMSDALMNVQEQIDLSLYHSNIVQWKFSESDQNSQIFTTVPVAFQALTLNWEFIQHNVSIDYQEMTKNAFIKCLKEGVPINIEIPIVLDQIIWISMRGGRSEVDKDHLFGVYFDMTELMKLKEDLEEQKQSAINASLAKSEFLANMSHEIRAPLQGMLAVLELLMMSSTTDELKQMLVSIQVSFYRLLELLNDTLDLAKIEQNRMQPSFCSFDVTDVLEPIVMHFKKTIKEKKDIKFFFLVDAYKPLRYDGDPHFVNRITNNLISNAVKFTKQGHITLQIDGDDENLVVSVEDTGIGINNEMQKIMFDTFTLLDSSLTRNYQGSGVGLSVVAKLVKLLNGTIKVTSKINYGSKFTVSLPFKSTYCRYITKRLRDNKLQFVTTAEIPNLSNIASFLDFYGFVTKMWPDLDKSLPIGIIIVENSKEGLEIAARVHKESPDAQILVNIDPNDLLPEQVALFPKYVGFIYRPVLPSRLSQRIISRKLRKVHPDHLRSLTNQNPHLVELNMRVLIADDNKTNQIVMSKLISKMKCTYQCVSNGQEVIDALEKSQYDIVLMDQHMPVMDGPAATRIIRQSKDKPYHDIPIVAMTASVLKEDEDECLQAGMTAFVTKPVSMSQLSTVLSNLVKNNHQN